MMSTLILAESSIETVPEEISSHPSVVKHAKRKRKKPTEILLDRSFHHKAILKLENSHKRGRPDIVYHVLLDVTSTPLYRANEISFYIHTINDHIIRVGKGVRPPRAYFRFEGLFEQLFRVGNIKTPSGRELFSVQKMSFNELLREILPDRVIGFSRLGRYRPLHEIVKDSGKFKSVVFVVGGFPKGHFSKEILKFLDELYSIHGMGLDSSLVVSRLIYETEKAFKI